MPQQPQLPPIGSVIGTPQQGGELPPVGGVVGGSAPTQPSSGLPGIAGTIGQGVVDLGVGAAKSVPETLLHIIQLITNLSGQHQIDPTIQRGLEAVTPEGTMQGIGSAAGQVAQSVLPAGTVTRGADLVEAGVRGLPMLSGLPAKAQAVIGGLARAATEGAGTAAVSAAQGNSPVVGGIAGASLSALQPAVRGGAAILDRKAEDQMVRAMGREAGAGPLGKNDLAIARKRAPELLDRNFFGLTQEGAAAKAGTAYDAASNALDDALSKVRPNTGVNVNTPLQDIQSMMNALKVAAPNGSTLVPEASQAEFALLGRLKDELQTIGGLNARAQFPELRKLRMAWDKLGKWQKQGTALENIQAETYRSAANTVRAAMSQNNPAVAAANREFSFWSDVSDLLDKATMRPSNGPGMVSRGVGAAGGAALGSMFGGAEGAAAGSLLGNYAVALTKTNGWRYLSANAKNDLATALASGVPDKIRMALSAAVAQIPQQFQFEAKNAVGQSPISLSDTSRQDAIQTLIKQTMFDLDHAQSPADKAALQSKLDVLQETARRGGK